MGYFETGSHFVAQAGLEFSIFLLQSLPPHFVFAQAMQTLLPNYTFHSSVPPTFEIGSYQTAQAGLKLEGSQHQKELK